MCKIGRIIILGENDNIHQRIESICSQYAPTRLLSYAQCGGVLIPSDWEGAIAIVLSMLAPWNVHEVIQESLRIQIPVIGLHTFMDEKVKAKYLAMGMADYVSLFDFVDTCETILTGLLNAENP